MTAIVQPRAIPETAAAPIEFFQSLADNTRLRCLLLLAAEGELCVCELVHALDLSQPKISRHLKLLRDTGLVDDRRMRMWVHYRIADGLPGWARQVLATTLAQHRARRPFSDDTQRLASMIDRPIAGCGTT